MTTPLSIPAAAMPVVELLRAEVPRPDYLPMECTDGLRWSDADEIYSVCPMGLYPNAETMLPSSAITFLGWDDYGTHEISDINVKSFYQWWDTLTDALAAVDAVWPQETGAT